MTSQQRGPQGPRGDVAAEAEAARSGFWIRIRNSALQYIGVGWFLTQVFAVMGRQFGWPPWVGDWVILALGAGFVVAMSGSFVMAWRERMSSVPRHQTGLAVATLAAIAALAIWLPQRTGLHHVAGPSGLVSQGLGPFSTTANVDGFFLVHPQDPLVPTDVYIAEGQSISIWGEGRVNMAMASLVEAAQSGDETAYAWVGPAGEVDARGLPILRTDRGRAGRERCLLSRDAPYGALLAMIVPSDRIAPGTVRSLTMDSDLFVVGSHLETRARAGGYLVLGVNDVYIDRPDCDPESTALGHEPGIFYRDNVGFFTVRIMVD